MAFQPQDGVSGNVYPSTEAHISLVRFSNPLLWKWVGFPIPQGVKTNLYWLGAPNDFRKILRNSFRNFRRMSYSSTVAHTS